MKKLVRSKRMKFLLIISIAIVISIVCFEIALYSKQKGNFFFYVENSGASKKDCFDLLLKINGKDVFIKDSLGWCNTSISMAADTMLLLPIGVNTIEVSSRKLDIYYKKNIINLLYMYGCFEINNRYDSTSLNSFKKIRVRYGYGKLMLM